MTPWGTKTAKRSKVDVFRDVPPELMDKIYVSQVGIHIDEIDLDVNSAGLLASLFPELSDYLIHSYLKVVL